MTGTFAVVQLLIGNAVENMLSDNSELHDCRELTTSDNNNTVIHFNGKITSCGVVKVDIVITLSFMSGIILVLKICLIC